MKELTTPKSLTEAIRYYSNEAVCVEFLSNLKWGGSEKCCPKCGSTAVYGLRTRPVFKCLDCKKQFSIKVGTIMQDSALPITKWVPAIWMVVNCKNGISSCEMARALEITQKSAWHMNHRIRQAIANGSVTKLSGTIEADETFVGGKDKNRHASKKRYLNPAGPSDKTVVFGMVERQGRVTAKVVDTAQARNLKPEIAKHVEAGSVLYTDDFSSYAGLEKDYYRATVNHSEKEYVRGDVHTNNIENYWSLVKRMLKGTYIHVEPFHLDRYLDEQGFRYNLRKGNDSDRFTRVASQIFGTTLTYAELTGRANNNEPKDERAKRFRELRERRSGDIRRIREFRERRAKDNATRPERSTTHSGSTRSPRPGQASAQLNLFNAEGEGES